MALLRSVAICLQHFRESSTVYASFRHPTYRALWRHMDLASGLNCITYLWRLTKILVTMTLRRLRPLVGFPRAVAEEIGAQQTTTTQDLNAREVPVTIKVYHDAEVCFHRIRRHFANAMISHITFEITDQPRCTTC